LLNPLEASQVGRRDVLKDSQGAEISSQILAVHTALVKLDPNENSLGQMVHFGGDQHHEDGIRLGGSHIRNTRVFDCGTNQIYDPDPNFPTNDLFCSGHAFLSDGTLFIAGGTDKFLSGGHHGAFGHFTGIRSAWIFRGILVGKE
jgi:hypothetical protein